MTIVSERIRVPRTVWNPAQYLLDEWGYTEPQLAVAWGLKSTSSVQKIRTFHHVPKVPTAELMADTFGWTAGQVIDLWLARVKAGGHHE